MLDRPMPKPVLDCPRIVPLIGQSVAARVPQHMDMDGEIEASAFADAFNEAIYGVIAERSVALGAEYELAVWKLALKLT
jgi:hypothetical protein